MAKIVVLELGFEDDEEAEAYYENYQQTGSIVPNDDYEYDVIECRVENP